MLLPSFRRAGFWAGFGLAACWAPVSSCGRSPRGLPASCANFGQFVFGRAILGLGEAPQFPTGARVVRDWFNVRSRGLATGVFNCSSPLGTAIAAPLLTVVMLAVGWRWMFGIMGFAGVVVAISWVLLYRDPAAIALTREEDTYRTAGDETGEATRVTFNEWRRLFGCATTWGMIIGFFGVVYLTWVYSAWLPGLSRNAAAHDDP